MGMLIHKPTRSLILTEDAQEVRSFIPHSKHLVWKGHHLTVVPHGLDETSKHIIEQLQEDGRRPYAAIGKAVGLSEAAVRQRVQRLLDAGVMQIVAVTDPLQVGFSRQAMIGIKVEGDMTEVAARLAEMDEVREA